MERATEIRRLTPELSLITAPPPPEDPPEEPPELLELPPEEPLPEELLPEEPPDELPPEFAGARRTLSPVSFDMV